MLQDPNFTGLRGAYNAPPEPLADRRGLAVPSKALGPSDSFLWVSGFNPLQNWQPY